jgi:hypothetical protein
VSSSALVLISVVIGKLVGYYALFVLVCHGIKTGLYAYFKSHRKEWNSIADREEMEEHIAHNLGLVRASRLIRFNFAMIDCCCLTAKLRKLIETNDDMLKKLHK